ncbi:unnamed protein product [Cuscuta europaea]|uniref:Uncharacterized protein n=1 Tax=Cuscuta europaea TaxID=41803 RepID=A0A9P0ZQA9_CUSEU|nr:unnamed protein product [Cuscuta europaea]
MIDLLVEGPMQDSLGIPFNISLKFCKEPTRNYKPYNFQLLHLSASIRTFFNFSLTFGPVLYTHKKIPGGPELWPEQSPQSFCRPQPALALVHLKTSSSNSPSPAATINIEGWTDFSHQF